LTARRDAAPADAVADREHPARDPVARLKRRADFLRAANGRKSHARALTVQMTPRPMEGGGECVPESARVGLTVTKRVGGAVERNRIRRRLREALRAVPQLAIRPGHDYVIVARRDALAMPFSVLTAELDRAVRRVHAKPADAGRHGDARDGGRGRDPAEGRSDTAKTER
jgi:ribonuclease P protein component